MKKNVWAVGVKESDYRSCPECNGRTVQAIENGYMVDGISTDLFFCCDCSAHYIVFPDWFFTGKGKKQKLAEFPKKIEIEISASLVEHSARCMERAQNMRAFSARLAQKETA